MNKKSILVVAGLSGALCVALGAMGPHALKDKISADHLQTYETAVRYHFYHTLALLLVALLFETLREKFMNYASFFFTVGIVLFSFSLYFLALRPLMGIPDEDMKWVGAITPFGGLSFIAGWLMIFYAALKTRPRE